MATAVDTKIGLQEGQVNETVAYLKVLLADIHVMYVKTLNSHWNMEDPRFYFLHKMLEEQYEALEEEGDLVAEMIRQLGRKVPASLQEFKELARIKEFIGPLTANEMLQGLVDSYDQLIRDIRVNIDKTTNVNDFGTADMLTEILRSFEKRVWMLRSHFPK